MEPITTSAMIGGIVSYLGTQFAKNKSISGFLSDFTEATVNWIKPLFIKEDGSLQKETEKLKDKPESESKKNALKAMLASELEDNPDAEAFIREIFEKITKTDEGGKIVTNIINSKNVNTGNVNTGGGDFTIGDGNNK